MKIKGLESETSQSELTDQLNLLTNSFS